MRFLLVIVVFASLAGCGKKPAPASPAPASDATQSSSPETESTQDKQDDEGMPPETRSDPDEGGE